MKKILLPLTAVAAFAVIAAANIKIAEIGRASCRERV